MSKKVQSNIYGDITPLQYLFSGSDIELNHHIMNIFGEDPSKSYTPTDIFELITNDYPDISEDKVTSILTKLTNQGNLERVLPIKRMSQKPRTIKDLQQQRPYTITDIGRHTHEMLINLKNIETAVRTRFDNEYFINIHKQLNTITNILKKSINHEPLSEDDANEVVNALDVVKTDYHNIKMSIRNLNEDHSKLHNLIANNDDTQLLETLRDFIQRIRNYVNQVYEEIYKRDNLINIQKLTEELKTYDDVAYYTFYDNIVHKTTLTLKVIKSDDNDLYKSNIEHYVKRTKEIIKEVSIIDDINDEMNALFGNVKNTLEIIRTNMQNQHQQQLFIDQVQKLEQIDSIEDAHKQFEEEFNTIELNHFNVKNAKLDTTYDLIFLNTKERDQKPRQTKQKKQIIVQSDEDIKLKEERKEEHQRQIELFNDRIRMLFKEDGTLVSTMIQDEDVFSKLTEDIVQTTSDIVHETTLGQSFSDFIITIEREPKTTHKTMIESPTRKFITSKVIIKRQDVN